MKCFPYLFLFIGFSAFGQNFVSQTESYPTFSQCKDTLKTDQESCFKTQLKSLILKYYKEPEVVAKEDYKGTATVIFEVDKEGGF
jgi:hypothetical protein